MSADSDRALVPRGPPTWPELGLAVLCGLGGLTSLAATGGALAALGRIALAFALAFTAIALTVDDTSGTEPAYAPGDLSLIEVALIFVLLAGGYPGAMDVVSFLPAFPERTASAIRAGVVLAFAAVVAIKTARTVDRPSLE